MSPLTHPGQCVHDWHPREVLSVAFEDSYREECSKCGSRCTRDPKSGLIVSYVRNAPAAQEPSKEQPHD